MATKTHLGFWKNVFELLRSRLVVVEPRGLPRNAPMAITVIKTIWPVAGSDFTDSFKRIRRRLPHEPSRTSLKKMLNRTPICTTNDGGGHLSILHLPLMNPAASLATPHPSPDQQPGQRQAKPQFEYTPFPPAVPKNQIPPTGTAPLSYSSRDRKHPRISATGARRM